MSLSDIPAHWWIIGWFGIMVLVLSFMILNYWLDQRRASRLPRKTWLAADLADSEDMAKFEASDAIACAFASQEEFLKLVRDEPSMHRWRHQKLRWTLLDLPTDEDNQPASGSSDWARPALAPSGVFLTDQHGRWVVLIGPLIQADHRHRVLLDDEGHPWETLTIAQVYQNWKHPRLPPVRV